MYFFSKVTLFKQVVLLAGASPKGLNLDTDYLYSFLPTCHHDYKKSPQNGKKIVYPQFGQTGRLASLPH